MLPNVNRGCTAAGVGGSSGNGQDGSEGKDGNILSISKDGTICFWKSNLTLHKTINVSNIMFSKHNILSLKIR